MSDENAIFFDGWESLAQTALLTPLLYLTVVLAIRVSGKRTTGQMNNFDWIVTVAIGSITASGIVIERVSYAEAGLAIAILIALQYALTKLVWRSERAARIVKSRPRLLVEDGHLNRDALKAERISEDEIHAALRQAGIPSLHGVRWMALENDGNFSVLTREGADDASGHVPGEPGSVMGKLFEQ